VVHAYQPHTTLQLVRTTYQVDDTAAAKLTGSLINALIFVATVTVATFCIFLLFKYNCTKAIWGFMAFSGLSVFFVFGDVIILAVLQEVNLAVDTVSFYLMMWNFSVVGIVSVFFWEMPLTLKQGTPACPPRIITSHHLAHTPLCSGWRCWVGGLCC
jgi:hypothetical protein